MLYRDLKKIANESLFNPNDANEFQKIIMDVGNPKYWITRAIEKLLEANKLVENSITYHDRLKEAITLLILTRASLNEKSKKDAKTRKHTTGPDSSLPKTT